MGVRDFAGFKSGQAHIVGQPFTVEALAVPCNAKIRCNCGGATESMTIQNSTAVQCPSCHKIYNCAFNPSKNSVEFQIATPQPEPIPS